MSIWKTEWGYRADFPLNGELIRAKGFLHKGEARQWVKDEKKRLKDNQQRFSSSGKDLALWTLAQKYLADSKVIFPKKTFDEKRSCLERFYKFAGDVSVVDITPPVILDFVNERAKTGSNNSANKDRKNLRAFYSWVQQMYGVLYDPTAPIKMKPHTKAARRLIPIQDILKVMLAATGHDQVLLGAYWNTGARKGEVLRWTWADDVNFEERWVRLGTRKNLSGEIISAKLWMNDVLHYLLLRHGSTSLTLSVVQ